MEQEPWALAFVLVSAEGGWTLGDAEMGFEMRSLPFSQVTQYVNKTSFLFHQQLPH